MAGSFETLTSGSFSSDPVATGEVPSFFSGDPSPFSFFSFLSRLGLSDAVREAGAEVELPPGTTTGDEVRDVCNYTLVNRGEVVQRCEQERERKERV